MGRKRSTGRFETREELIEKIRFLYQVTDRNMSQIAENVGVAAPTVARIIDEMDMRPAEIVEPVEHLSVRDLMACGDGYDFPLYTLHLPDVIKRELELI
jgi:hypothetical protein